jgi:hypothetical protein
VYRELGRLLDAGIVEKRVEGRNTIYLAASDSPLFVPLRTLLERTVASSRSCGGGSRA